MPLVALAAGRRLSWPGLTLDVLGPPHPASDVDPDDGTAVNDRSLVVRATTTAGTILLAGDAELAEQSDLLATGQPLRADILKMPHHGSRYSSPAFLSAVGPRVVLVSVGAGNTYGQPNVRAAHGSRARGRGRAPHRHLGGRGRRRRRARAAGRAELQVVTRGDPTPARGGGRAGRRAGVVPAAGFEPALSTT